MSNPKPLASFLDAASATFYAVTYEESHPNAVCLIEVNIFSGLHEVFNYAS